MKRLVLAAAVAVAASPIGAADVGVSISVGEPGFYGRIDIGGYPQPQVVYPEPVVIQHVPVGVVHEPIYLRVPPGHAKNWHKHCSRYNACDRPVYFVRDDWYNDVYVRHYRERRGERGEHRGRDERHDEGRGEGHGKGHGRGHGGD